MFEGGEAQFISSDHPGTLHIRACAMLTIACILAAAVVGIVVYLTWIVKPKRVKFTAGIWKFLSLSFEADAGSEPKLPPPPDKPISSGQ
jgi:hypothetical protein